MRTHRFLSVLALLACVLSSGVLAQELDLPGVPDGISTADREALIADRAGLLERWDRFLKDKAAYLAEFGDVTTTDHPRYSGMEQRKSELMTENDAIVDDAESFIARVEILPQIAALDVQIMETAKQLRGLGFKSAVNDFSWFAGQSEMARQQMIGQLISRVRDYTIAKSEEAMQDWFLGRIRAMKPKDVRQLADNLEQFGADAPRFQRWLRSFEPSASRRDLVEGANLAIDAVKGAQDLFAIHEELDKRTIQGRQEAALTLISMVIEYPGMDELKLVASGGYDVVEAWATIYCLHVGIEERTESTERMLADQKAITQKMKTLVDKRRKAREALSKLPPRA